LDLGQYTIDGTALTNQVYTYGINITNDKDITVIFNGVIAGFKIGVYAMPINTLLTSTIPEHLPTTTVSDVLFPDQSQRAIVSNNGDN
jgi:hypothetical protein